MFQVYLKSTVFHLCPTDQAYGAELYGNASQTANIGSNSKREGTVELLRKMSVFPDKF